MADINIDFAHEHPKHKARAILLELEPSLKQRYELGTSWKGDTLCFERSGLSGTLALAGETIEVRIEVSFMMKMFASTIEQGILKELRERFA